MLRRRLLAGLTVLGLAGVSRAQSPEKPTCRAENAPRSVYVQANSEMVVATGGSPISANAYETVSQAIAHWAADGALLSSPANYELVCKLPEDEMALRITIPGSGGARPKSVDLFVDNKYLYTVSGDKLMSSFDQFDLVRRSNGEDIDDFVCISFGAKDKRYPLQERIVQTLLDGGSLTLKYNATIEDKSSSARVQFANIGERRAVGLRLWREQTARYERGECKLEPSSGCYLTTAAVDTVGLADDCWELQTLRRFRDNFLVLSSGGRALIATYYACAPELVRRVSRRPDARTQWLRTYFTGILPSALAAHFGLTGLALGLYRQMTNRLLRLE